MKTLAFVLLGCIAIAAAKPNLSLKTQSAGLRSLLESLLAKKQEHPKPAAQSIAARSGGGDQCDVPCVDIADDEEFFGCVMEQAQDVEAGFNDFYLEKTGENIFSAEEMEVVWYLRQNWALSVELRGIMEELFESAATVKFYENVDFESMTAEDWQTLGELDCLYRGLKEAAYGRLDKK